MSEDVISINSAVKENTLVNDGISADKTGKPVRSKKPRIYRDRGVVYLSHIPPGFHEKEMKGFFGQFGHVTRLRLVRSEKTGNSKGYAFIEFRFKEVAQVVADSMNNYLMRNRLLKANVIPSEKVNSKMFRHGKSYGPESCIGVINRKKAIKEHNKPLSEEDVEIRANDHKKHLFRLQEKLKAQGVDCLFQIEGGSSKRILEETENALALKKIKTEVKTLKPTVTAKQSVATAVPKKQPGAAKSKITQKGPKVKLVKTVADKSSKQTSDKNEKKKVLAKKSVEKKSGVKVVKKVAAKTDLVKKDTAKKAVAKKKVLKK